MYLRQFILGKVLVLSLLASSCGGGGGGGGVVGIDGSGSRVTSVSETGPINGFGSVIVNGVHYDTDNAKVFIRGELADESELNVGDFVVVVGHINSKGEGTAYEVHYQPMVTGAIQSVDYDRGTFKVLNQEIIVLEDTTFSNEILPRNIEGLKKGQTVTVSGISDDNKAIRASRIASATGTNLDFVGKIESFNEFDQTYLVNGVSIDLSQVETETTPATGDWIAISGEQQSNGVIQADHVNETMDYTKLESVETIKMNGFVSALYNGYFYLDRVPAMVTPNTIYEGGTAEDLKNNSKVEIEGALDYWYTLIVKKVKFIPVPTTQAYGQISRIEYAPFGDYYLGSIEVQGSTFKIGYGTKLIGDYEKRISFYDLIIWDTVMVSGFYKDDKYVATSVTVDNREIEDNIIQMQGWVGAINFENASFTLFSSLVTTDEETLFANYGSPISREQFLSMVSMGKLVQIRGKYEGFTLKATNVQLNPVPDASLVPPTPPAQW